MNKKPDFSKLAFQDKPVDKAAEKAAWQAQVEKETGNPLSDLLERTMEQIDVAPLYTKDN